jgi:fido (protein-threonine AMPylation protein)
VNVGKRFRGADPEQIVYELELARLQTDKLFETGNHLEAVAFFHLRFERIHPFLDGNGRVGRALPQSQLAAEFGFRMSLVFKKSEYTAALHAGERNLLGPLMQCIGRAAELSFDPGLYQSLYRISPDPDYVQGKGIDVVCKNREDNTYAIGNPQLMLTSQ